MADFFQIAIDGPTASGKGTAARLLARKFGFLCLDTGALYRGITIYFLDNNINHEDTVAVVKAVRDLDLSVKCIEGRTLVFLNGGDITGRLRDNAVSNHVFKIAKIPEIRIKVREIQRAVAKRNTLICEGRDITSVVFPDARFKFYLTASLKIRARRRWQELRNKGSDIRLKQVINEINARDKADMMRKESPLKHVKDAVLIDTTGLVAYDAVRRMEKVITVELVKQERRRKHNV